MDKAVTGTADLWPTAAFVRKRIVVFFSGTHLTTDIQNRNNLCIITKKIFSKTTAGCFFFMFSLINLHHSVIASSGTYIIISDDGRETC